MAFGSPKLPASPPVPRRDDSEVAAEAAAARRRSVGAQGRQSTILAGNQALAPATRTVLGGA